MPDPKANLVRAIGRLSLAALMMNIMIGGGVFEVPASGESQEKQRSE